MPNAQNNPAINVRRFAALLAGFDLGNTSEEEAVSKGRALRKMAENAKMRIVDLMELPEVKQAIDEQMQPMRTESLALNEALEQSAALQKEVMERTRDVRRLAESLRERDEAIETMRRELSAARSAPVQACAASSPASGAPGVPFFGVQIGAALIVVVLLIVAVFTGNFRERSNGNGYGSREGKSAAVVRKGGTVRPLPKHGAVRDRVHHGGAPDRTR